MNRPWMPLYIADYLADTAHLSTAEHGAYLLLIMHYWQTGALPPDDAKLARIARMTGAEWKRARKTIEPFFADEWRHKRIDAELARAADVSSKRRAAAEQRHSKQPANADAIAHANAEQLETHARTCASASQPQSQTHQGRDKPPPESSLRSETRAVAQRAAEGFERFWTEYPRREGGNPKKPAALKFLTKVRQGANPEAIIAGARAYAADVLRLGTEPRFVTMAITWLNQDRWKDYTDAPAVAGSGAAHPVGWRPGMPTDEELRRLHEADDGERTDQRH